MMAPSTARPAVRVLDDLAEHPRWGVWRREPAKVPYQVNGHRADTTNPRHWGEIERAQAALATGRYTGLAFAFFREDGLVGIDLDDCLVVDGTVKPWARGIIERFSDTYMETSPSGRGIKIWARGSLPANLPKVRVEDGGVEMYGHARYFAFTGQVFRGAPLEVEDHARDVLALYEGLTAGKRSWKLQPLQGGRIPHGQQHSTLISIAGTLRARRVCESAIVACLLEVNRVQLERPAPPENIRRIVASTRKWGAV